MDQLLEVVEAANRIPGASGEPVSGSYLRYLADSGKLPCIRTARGQRLFRTSDVERFVRERQQRALEATAK